jgi:hypothetical protein
VFGGIARPTGTFYGERSSTRGLCSSLCALYLAVVVFCIHKHAYAQHPACLQGCKHKCLLCSREAGGVHRVQVMMRQVSSACCPNCII